MKSSILWIILSICLFVSGLLFVSVGYGSWRTKIIGFSPTNCEIVGYDVRNITCTSKSERNMKNTNNIKNTNKQNTIACQQCYVIYVFVGKNETIVNSKIYIGLSKGIGNCNFKDYPLYSNTPCYYKGNQIIIDTGAGYVMLLVGVALSILSFIITTFLLLFKLKKRRIIRF